MTQIEDRLRSGLRAEAEAVARVGTTAKLTTSDRPRILWSGVGVAAVTAVVVLVVVGGVALLTGGGRDVADDSVPTPSSVPAVSGPDSPFQGTWVTTDGDGSTPTATFDVSGDGVVEMVVVDDYASVCSGVPSTMTGTGRLEGDTVLVISVPVYTCDDGSQAEALSGPPLEEQLHNLTFVHDPETDTLTDNLGSLWTREGAGDPSPGPAPEDPSPGPTLPEGIPTISEGMWPQSSLEEFQAAQELADAGDPDYTWQLDLKLAADEEPWGAEIFARFMEEELGWEEFIGGWDGSGYVSMGVGGGMYEGVVFVRCAPGETNPLNSLYAEAPPEIRGCAPTIDELRYETVRLDVSQPGRRGPEGIWVVDRWEVPQSKSSDPGSLWGLLYPEFDRQVAQVAPPSDTDVTALLEAFLGARVDGEGAEPYLLREPENSPFEDQSVPLLYATTGGAPYQRFEIEHVQGPVWPSGWSEFKVRLFAEGGTVVEQSLVVIRHENGQLGLVYGYPFTYQLPTTENGQTVALPYSILDGEVTFAAAPPWGETSDPVDTLTRFNGSRDDHVVIATDPPLVGTGCENGPAAADAEELARRIMADPDFETTGAVPVLIAGIDGLQMDVDAAVGDWNEFCWPWIPDQADRWRMRLYLIDYPGEAAAVLTIAVIAAPETDFERVLEEATPIVESVELHPG